MTKSLRKTEYFTQANTLLNILILTIELTNLINFIIKLTVKLTTVYVVTRESSMFGNNNDEKRSRGNKADNCVSHL